MRKRAYLLLALACTGCATQPQSLPRVAECARPEIDDWDQDPVIELQVDPVVPAVAGAAEGWAIVTVDVSKEGSVTRATVSDSHPAGVFDETVIAAALQSKFRPATRQGRPVPSVAHLSYTFTTR